MKPKKSVKTHTAWTLSLFGIPELPESMCLNFDCGARIKLGFAAEFSNVLVIYTHIVKKPADMSSCEAHVTDFSQVSMVLLAHCLVGVHACRVCLCMLHTVTGFFSVLQDLDVDPKEMNRETPEETGIYFLSSSLPQHCLYTRVSALQKLKVKTQQ